MYLARRANLKLLILLADSRREPQASDAGVLEYAEDKEDRPYKILLVATKVCCCRVPLSVLCATRCRREHKCEACSSVETTRAAAPEYLIFSVSKAMPSARMVREPKMMNFCMTVRTSEVRYSGLMHLKSNTSYVAAHPEILFI